MSVNVPLTARWIWLKTDRDTELFVRARRPFELTEAPHEATVRITCSGLYRLWINGKFAGRGPARSAPCWKRYDLLPVGRLLRSGVNVLAVQVIHFGYLTAATNECPGGLCCQLDAAGSRLTCFDDVISTLLPNNAREHTEKITPVQFDCITDAQESIQLEAAASANRT